MRTKRAVSIRELRERAPEIMQQVRAKRLTIQITSRGRVIAELIPVPESRPFSKEASAVWTDLDRLAVEIGARWPNDVSAAHAVREGRRKL